MSKKDLKNVAIQLRKKGRSYSEILKKVPVSKSTLSLWLRSVNLSKKQEQTLILKKLRSAWRGGEIRKRDRIERTKKIVNQAKEEIDIITDKELLLLGTMLYWAEGSKEKSYNPSVGVIFSNSDSRMIKLYLKWLKKSLNISIDNLIFGIYVHKVYKSRIKSIRQFWSKETNLPVSLFQVYFKKNKLEGNRKNKGLKYNGLLRITVRKSSSLNRKISGWIDGVCKQCGIV